MPQNILIATLGEHPAVVTGMVKALREIAGIKIDTLQVVHTQESKKQIETFGFMLIEEQLQGICQVESKLLPFADVNSQAKMTYYLSELAKLIDYYSQDTVIYLSLAGGRKNMSALMALTTQFFPAVKGLYHLLDKREQSSKPTFYSSEYLYEHWDKLTQQQKDEAINPPLENLNLVEIPYPQAFAESLTLWEAINQLEIDKKPLPITLTPEAESFWRSVVSQKPLLEDELEVWLSKTAIEQYESLGNDDADRFWKCFQQMKEPLSLKRGWHHEEDGLSVYKRTNRQRPLFYTEPNSIISYPQKLVKRVIICGLSVEYALGITGPYEPTIKWQTANALREPYKQLEELNSRERILLIPLGTSPMIATQTYTLLQESKAEGRPKIAMVAVLHTSNKQVTNGVNLLKKQFKLKKVEFKSYPIEIEDIDSKEHCEEYIKALRLAIEDLQKTYPDRQIALSLSGGRKGMSALTLFAAQYEGIEQVYHTLINDAELEKQIEHDTEQLPKLPTDQDKARILFLDKYDKRKFELFAIPIIPFAKK